MSERLVSIDVRREEARLDPEAPGTQFSRDLLANKERLKTLSGLMEDPRDKVTLEPSEDANEMYQALLAELQAPEQLAHRVAGPKTWDLWVGDLLVRDVQGSIAGRERVSLFRLSETLENGGLARVVLQGFRGVPKAYQNLINSIPSQPGEPQ